MITLWEGEGGGVGGENEHLHFEIKCVLFIGILILLFSVLQTSLLPSASPRKKM